MQYRSTTTANPTHWRTFYVLFALLFLLILFPILRADRYYNDDVARAITGFYGWDINGRPLATLVMRLLQFNLRHLVDISPLPQIGAIVVLSAIGVLIARRYRLGSPWLAALVSFPLGAQPFYLENLSYRFDALGMSLALLFALLPFLACRDDYKGRVFGQISLFASLCLYQPALSVFLTFALAEWVIAQLDGREPRELLSAMGWRIAQCVVAIVAYKVIVARTIDDWLKQHSATVGSTRELWMLKANASNFYGYIAQSFNIHWARCAGALLLLAGPGPFLAAIRYIRQRPQTGRVQCLAWLAAGLLIPVLAVLAITLPMLPLRSPVVMPRVFMGVGALLCASLVSSCLLMRAWRLSDHWTLTYAGFWALGMASFAAIYGNALGAQKSFEDRVVAQLSDDLAAIAAKQPIRFILIDGSVGFAPVTLRAAQQFPLIETLVLPYLREADFRTAFYLRYYLRETPELAREPDSQLRVAAILAQACKVSVNNVSSNYALRIVGDTVVATFPSGTPKSCH